MENRYGVGVESNTLVEKADLIRETPSSATSLFMLPILATGLFTLAIIALHFYKRLSSSLTPMSSSATSLFMPLIFALALALALALLTLAFIALHFHKTHTNQRDGQGQGSFDVFLIFLGSDVGATFICHLYDALIRKGIRTFMNDKDLPIGEEIDGSLMRAIEDSRIAVVLLSEKYASSSWCLDELAKITERRKEGKIVVKPVFYRVDPREVRTPRDSFAKALAVHEAKLGKDSEKVKRWREALFEIGSLSGWHLDEEADLIRETPSSATSLFMPLILAIVLFTLAIIALHFFKTHTNKRLSSSLSSSAATDGTGSTFSTSPNPEQSPRGRTDCLKGQEQGSFHVFLSFRGPDVRHTFLGHLYDAFIREGIRAYIDDEELRKGEEIEGSLMRAIEDSRIAVILLSENYASSRWCLKELAKIMECRKEGKLLVMPVFYRVDPREVRTPRESFAKALADHEAKLGKDSDMVKRWREDLFEIGSLSGLHLDANGHEAELVRRIIKDVNVLLDRPLLDVAKYPVGIGARVEQIKDLLRLDSGDVLFFGLWGMGGVGKTTLAKAVFNDIADQFEGYAFLQNVREESTNPCIGLTKLQEKLLSEVLRRKDVKVLSTAGGSSLIKDRLSSKKVLLLLDDLSDSEQLDALAGGLDWFGRGSRILITTRDSSLLTVCNEYVVHKVEELPYEEALQLFSRHAFLESNQTSISKDLVDRCLHYAKGLPLALVVLGSLLRNRPEHHWKSTLKKLADSPAKDIDKVLRVSIDGLERNEREIFLDIACFFNGLAVNYIENVMVACGFEASIGIQILFERSLITIDGYSIKGVKQVRMHDLLQSTGKNIVCENFPDEPASRSRLWEYDHVRDVISSGDETIAVEAIVVYLSNPRRIFVDANALTKLRKLRLLIMHNVTYYGEPLNFPSGLCWMDWRGYSGSTFVFNRNTGFKHMRHINLE